MQIVRTVTASAVKQFHLRDKKITIETEHQPQPGDLVLCTLGDSGIELLGMFTGPWVLRPEKAWPIAQVTIKGVIIG